MKGVPGRKAYQGPPASLRCRKDACLGKCPSDIFLKNGGIGECDLVSHVSRNRFELLLDEAEYLSPFLFRDGFRRAPEDADGAFPMQLVEAADELEERALARACPPDQRDVLASWMVRSKLWKTGFPSS